MSMGLGWGLAAGLAAAVLFGVGAVLQASAVRRQVAAAGRLSSFVSRAVRDPRTLLAVTLYGLGFLLHVVAVALLPLYLAQATVAMSLPVAALVSRVVSDHLHARHWGLLAAITVGLVLLALGSGRPGPPVTDPPFALALVVGVLGVAVLGPLMLRLAGPATGGVVLGAAAGVGYAGSAIAIRGLDWPVGATVVVAALAVPAFSLVAFWLYSLGMSRDGVPHVTAPLTVISTFLPALVGVAWLGDGVRDGWWPGVVGGLVLATAGTLLLGRDAPVAADSPRRLGRG